MKRNIKSALVASVLATAFSAGAVQKDINVTADIDPTVDVTLADGTPLPASVAMQYLPGKGLTAHTESIKFWANAVDKDLSLRLVNTPALTDVTGTTSIPLSVTVNGTKLTTTAATLPYASTFPSGIANGSSAMPLVIAQETPGTITNAGIYSGVVSLVVTQATTGV
ncbi:MULTISPECIES: CS1 type fimbrial major subunit [Enterobacter cloacae complex]|uniref:CS1 type fimbrial major subunit n=1 Tax=Enterobacter cloacae complex TaxID=354276 RepID=UPI0029738C25|nr:CS1 type fimbrial major subunit [Enterobacter roggenkampii]MEB6513680.1 fimbrial protein [Enterobacter roggenkampii]HAS1172437.1 fimbrial assembly protein [Enterobacter cloacae]